MGQEARETHVKHRAGRGPKETHFPSLSFTSSSPLLRLPIHTPSLRPSGVEGPKTKEPSKYIRYIFNRIILENATVRAAAVSSLAAFGASAEGLRPRVITLLQRALADNDDEVGVCVEEERE